MKLFWALIAVGIASACGQSRSSLPDELSVLEGRWLSSHEGHFVFEEWNRISPSSLSGMQYRIRKRNLNNVSEFQIHQIIVENDEVHLQVSGLRDTIVNLLLVSASKSMVEFQEKEPGKIRFTYHITPSGIEKEIRGTSNPEVLKFEKHTPTDSTGDVPYYLLKE